MTEQMSGRSASVAPGEVRDFVAHVREHLQDLDADEQRELTTGLEADLTELVAERGSEALGDPALYARELRTAAGHDPVMSGGAPERGVRSALMAGLESAHATWARTLEALPGDVGGFLLALQPTWWVLRAWVAWMVAQGFRGPHVVAEGPWLVVLAVFVVVSVQLGRRTWGLDRLLAGSLPARLVLVGLNVFAVAMLPDAADRLAWHIAEQRAWQFGWDGF